MTAAGALASAGLTVTVLEASDHVSHEWRASTFHPPTLEHLEPLGVVPRMLESGLIADRYQIHDRQDGLVAEFDYQVIADDTRYPFRLQLEQYKLVELMAEYLEGLPNADVRLGHRLTGFEDDGDRVTVTARTLDGEEVAFAADYLIGADGATSTIRKLLEIPYEGWTYAQRFMLISSTFPFDQHLPQICGVNYFSDPREFVMLLRIPEVWRVLVPLADDVSDAEATELSNLRRVIEGIVPDPIDWSAYDIPLHQVYRVHQRVADRLRVGRVFLIGDAAHVNSPIGGFGLNSGVHDALDLARRLERAHSATPAQADADLDRFSDVRRAVALSHIRRMSDRNTRTLAQTDPAARRAELEGLARIAGDRQFAREWLLDAAMITAVREHPLGE